MKKKHFAVIGHPINHTMSPFIHKRLFEISGTSADYNVLNIKSHELSASIPTLKSLDGFNVTIPHKHTILPYLDDLSKKARLYESVNTVKNSENFKGYTTDADGFLKALEYANIPLKGRIVILGSGGVARTIAYEAAFAGCDITIAVRPSGLPKAASLAEKIRANLKSSNIQTCLISELCGDIDLLINATPVGMHPQTHETPVNANIISRCRFVFDAVYNPAKTLLLKIAKSNGSGILGGTSMLVIQAALAQQIWNDSQFKSDDILQLCEDTNKEMKKLFPED